MSSAKKLIKNLSLLLVLLPLASLLAVAVLAADGATIYNSNCAGCHKLGTFDTSGSAPDLLGKGSTVTSYFTGGQSHKGITLASADITTLAAFVNNPTAAVPLAISTAALSSGTVGVAYSQTLAATGGKTPYSWSVSSGTLPAGLSLSSAGVISGTPSATGTSSFTVRVADSSSPSTSTTKTLSITVSTTAAPISITTSSLVNGTVGTAYSQALAATGGTPPYTWSYNGTLPSGIVLTSAGSVTGTPTAAGTFTFTARVADSKSAAATKSLSLTVGAAASTPMSSSDKNLFLANCVACHTPTGVQNRTAAQIQTAINGNVGGMGTTQLRALTSTQVSGIARALVPLDPPATSCTTCHSSSTPSPGTTPTTGQGLYDSDCAGCHKLSTYDTSGSAPDLYQSTKIDSYFTAGTAGHKGFTLSSTDISNLKTFVNNPTGSSTPTPTPTPTTGQARYDTSCAGCHRMGSYDTSGSAPDLYQTTKVDSYYTAGASGHQGITLTSTDISNLKSFFSTSTTPTPAPTPTTGQAVYDANCASCHRLGTYDASGSAPNLSGDGSEVSEKYSAGVRGHQGITLTATQMTNLASFLNAH